ncbi:iron-siderophore ABC transporter substrate-binding protein [[Clostridium] colinum]|uniref:iron-siderophore ABC transporter substrate-binding protein n=1 Tax=[Clostridium] colinum TaxID=36835 RepID=UPI002025AD86|nr:iron-siderophore ABC transporter substrate-binding protein [[Clostridium] colinum]
MKLRKINLISIVILGITITGCTLNNENVQNSNTSNKNINIKNSKINEQYPITIKHAFGETVINSKPEHIATISWGNQDVPLSLGILPVGVSKANYGGNDETGLLPWTSAKFKELGEENPNVFDDTDGLDFEAISNSKPDVILASYSGITKEDYDLLSQIAPVIAYPRLAWQTKWREQIILNSKAMGMEEKGKELVLNLEDIIIKETSKYPQIKGKNVAFLYFNPSDLGKFYIYLPEDPRVNYLMDLGFNLPNSILNLSKESNSFALEISAENVEILNDVDIIICYGDEKLLKSLQEDKLIGTIPAIKRGSVALIEDGTPLAASATPSALSIPATIEEYVKILSKAVDKI